jgi:CubicO group peptidase (beta-lactamase class C family)
MAVVLLTQQGKLYLDDDIRDYIPEVPEFGEKITVRHLLHHISGMRDQWELLSLAGWRGEDIKTQDDVLELVKRQKELNFNPGEEYLYCNTGFSLAAILVQRLSGMSLREFADQHIFKPLGMDRTHFHDDMSEIVKGRAYAYSPRGDGFRINNPDYETYGATSLHTTVEDMAKWANNFKTKEVGGEAGIAQLLQRGKLNNGEEITYALGLMHGNYKGLRTVGHSGSDAGYRAQFTMFPEQDTAIIVLANVSNAGPGTLANRVADIVLADAIVEPEPTEPRGERRPTQQRTVERDETPELTAEELAEFEGMYYSEELDTTYRIVLDEDRLVLERRKFDPASLRVRDADSLSWGSRRLEFTRDENERIDGFRLTSGRVRNLRFVRYFWEE